MNIGTKYKIESDSLNIYLKERHENKKTGEVYWRSIGYFATPQAALKSLVLLNVRESELKDLETVIKELNKIYRKIDGLRIPAQPL